MVLGLSSVEHVTIYLATLPTHLRLTKEDTVDTGRQGWRKVAPDENVAGDSG